MRQDNETEVLIADFLLDRLSEEARAQVEQKYASEPAFFEAVKATELELITSYLDGELTGKDRTDFEQCYLTSPDRARHVDFIRAITRESGGQGRRSWQWGAVAAGLALAFVLGTRMQPFSSRSAVHGDATVVDPRPSNEIVEYTPSSGQQRGGSGPGTELALTRGQMLIRFRLVAHSADMACRAVLKRSDGRELMSAAASSTPDGIVVFPVPSSILLPGDHLIELHCSGSQEGTYTFRAVQP